MQESSEKKAKSISVKAKNVINVAESPKTSNIPEAEPILFTILKAEEPLEILTETACKNEIEIISVEVYNSSVQELEESGQAYDVIFQNEIPVEQPIDNFDFIGITSKDDRKSKKEPTKLKDQKVEESGTICEEMAEILDNCSLDSYSDGEMSANEKSDDDSK